MGDLAFKPGDVVKHKAATFKMVVFSIFDLKAKTYRCVWYDPNLPSSNSGFVYENFEEIELELFKERR